MFKQALATQAASDLRLCLRLFFFLFLFFLFLFSSLLLLSQASNLAWTSTSLGAISLRFHPVSFHAAVCCQARGSYIVPSRYFAGGGTNLVYVRSTGCYSQHLLHKPLPFYGFVFVFLSSSSSSPSFLFCFSRGLPPRVRIKLPWGHVSMAGGLAEGN